MRGRGRGRGKEFRIGLQLQQADSDGTSSPDPYSASGDSGSPAEQTYPREVQAPLAGRGTGRGLFRPPPAQSYIYQPPQIPYSLICGPLRAQESLMDISSSSSDEANRTTNADDELLAQFRQLNSGIGRGRGRGQPSKGIMAISSNEFEGSSTVPRGIRSNFDDQRVRSSSVYTPLPLTSPSLSSRSTNSGPDSDDSNSRRETVIKRGMNGTIVPVVANYIWLNVERNKGIFQYHVHFDPPFENPKVKKIMLRDHVGVLGTIRNFDGAKLYLPFELPDQVTELESFNPNDSTMRVKITIKHIKPSKSGSYMRDYIQFCNVLFRRIMTVLGLINVNRQFYDIHMDAIIRLPNHRLEIWPGYVTSIEEREGGLLLCCDASFRVLRTDTTLDIWKDLQFAARSGELNPKEQLRSFLAGKIILTRYNNRHYRIDDIDWKQTPLSTFEYRGRDITFVEYYQSQYSIRIRDLEQPLLCHLPRPKKNDPCQGPLNPTLLIPELCYLTGLSEELTSNTRIMKDISRDTRLTPEQRHQNLQTFIKNVNDNVEAAGILKDWGLRLDDKCTQLEGRIVGEDLTLELNFKNIFTLQSRKYEFSKEAKNYPCYEPIAVKNWAIFCPPRDKDKAETMRNKYSDVCRSLGIKVQPGELHLVHGRRNDDYRKCIVDVLNKNPDLQFFTVIMPRRQDDLYGMIKKLACVDRPIPSQFILAKTLTDPRKIHSIMSKIALQINCKMGGGLWTIRMPREEKIMFIGMDVYHDPKQRSGSVTALVASLNDVHTKYFSKIVRQRVHQETMTSIRPIFIEALKEFYMANNCWPDRILVFRDGVGDGDLEATKEIEIVQLTDSLKRYCTNSPKFTYTVVQKRIHTRFFAQDPRTGKCSNPVPGTVLDHTVTRKYFFDFFLVSQLIHEGTVTPTHYIVLEDNSNIAPDLIQKFAFATSFMYYNWAGSIRVPAVCQYAHKLAYLVGQYLDTDPSDQLCKQLYYL